MMIMRFTEVSHMLSDVWNLYKKYALRKLDDAELEEFSNEVKIIYAKYSTPFAKQIILSVVNEVERTVRYFEKER